MAAPAAERAAGERSATADASFLASVADAAESEREELVTAAAMFNVFAFGVLSILSSVEFGIGAGFGLSWFHRAALAHPLGVVVMLTVFFRSAWHCGIRGEIPWRGRRLKRTRQKVRLV